MERMFFIQLNARLNKFIFFTKEKTYFLSSPGVEHFGLDLCAVVFRYLPLKRERNVISQRNSTTMCLFRNNVLIIMDIHQASLHCTVCLVKSVSNENCTQQSLIITFLWRISYISLIYFLLSF